MKLLAPISIGELYDKLSILEIKLERVKYGGQRINIKKELNELKKLRNEKIHDEDLLTELKEVNSQLWDIENRMRRFERDRNFGQEFIDAARSIYSYNARRHELKKTLNVKYNSYIIEEKCYEK